MFCNECGREIKSKMNYYHLASPDGDNHKFYHKDCIKICNENGEIK